MINCRETKILGRNFFKVRRLYLSAFPKIERHDLMELFSASSKGKAEFLQFTEDGKFLGLAYVIVRGSVAFLLYFAVDGSRRNRGYGSAILETIRTKYEGKDIVLLIESLHERCDNMDIRIRRKGFYLRNGFRDTGLIQTSFGGEADYEILHTEEQFSIESYRYLLSHYPFKSYLEEIRDRADTRAVPADRHIMEPGDHDAAESCGRDAEGQELRDEACRRPGA